MEGIATASYYSINSDSLHLTSFYIYTLAIATHTHTPLCTLLYYTIHMLGQESNII